MQTKSKDVTIKQRDKEYAKVRKRKTFAIGANSKPMRRR